MDVLDVRGPVEYTSRNGLIAIVRVVHVDDLEALLMCPLLPFGRLLLLIALPPLDGEGIRVAVELDVALDNVMANVGIGKLAHRRQQSLARRHARLEELLVVLEETGLLSGGGEGGGEGGG